MINITVIGKMGTGKTTFIKSFIKGRKAFVFDVNNEYKELPVEYRKPVSRMTNLDHKRYMLICLDKRNTVCVFEDATGFVEGRLSDNFRKALVGKRHTGNVNVLIFHSMLAVPPRLIQLSDYVVIFNTNDEYKEVYKKFPSLFNHWKEVKTASVKNPYANKQVKL